MKWEYKTIKLTTKGLLGGKFSEEDLDILLNRLGRDGWELVAAFDTNVTYGATKDVVAILKRALG